MAAQQIRVLASAVLAQPARYALVCAAAHAGDQLPAQLAFRHGVNARAISLARGGTLGVIGPHGFEYAHDLRARPTRTQ